MVMKKSAKKSAAKKSTARKTASPRAAKQSAKPASKPRAKTQVVAKNARGVQVTEVEVRKIVQETVAETVKGLMVEVLKEFGLTKAPAVPKVVVDNTKSEPQPQQARMVTGR